MSRYSAYALVAAMVSLTVLSSQWTQAEPAPSKVNPHGYWNQFRGPTADGRIPATGLPLDWSEQQGITWKTAIHGRAWSSPVVWGDRIWLTTATRDGTKLSVLSLDGKSGKVLSDQVVFEVKEPKFCHPTNTYASPTPFIEGDRLYVHFGQYGTACFNTESGKKLWQRRNFVCDDFRGPGSSPVVHGDLLLVHFDGVDVQYVVALNKHTGETVWKRDRDIDYGTDNPDRKKAYGTPLVITHHGRQQMISPSAGSTVSYDPVTGKELWRIQHGGMNAAARPLFDQGLLYISAGQGDRSLIAIDPSGEGMLSDERVKWSTGQAVPKRPSQILTNGLLLMVDDKGIASCLDAETGKLHWRERLGGEYWASPVLGDGRMYCCNKEGGTVVVAAAKEFKKLAENQLAAPIVASPAAIESDLLIRTETHLYRVGK